MNCENTKYSVEIKNDTLKLLTSDYFNYVFNIENGIYISWGKETTDDPTFSPFGPTIFDIEVTKKCSGIGGEDGSTPSKKSEGNCKFCYKSNTSSNNTIMTFETFKEIFNLLPNVLTQIAFGVDAKCKECPDIWKMMKYCRDNNVVPNITVADVSKDTAKKISEFCGGVSVSWYGDWDIFFNTIKNLYDSGVKQLCVHSMISLETKEQTYALLKRWNEIKNFVNAIVFLSLKKVGFAKEGFNVLPQDEFTKIIEYCIKNHIPFGSDSCGCHKVESAYKELNLIAPTKFLEPCESGLFSGYCSADGIFYPCSFLEREELGVHYKDVPNDFLNYIWLSKFEDFRNALVCNNRKCIYYEV